MGEEEEHSMEDLAMAIDLEEINQSINPSINQLSNKPTNHPISLSISQ